jgi:DNA modification methylase
LATRAAHRVSSTAARPTKYDRRGSKHPTVKPLDLIKWLCKLTMTPTGGAVLDPFMGSGTTMEACYELRRPFIGIEREQSYFDDVVSRAKEMTGRYGLLESA